MLIVGKKENCYFAEAILRQFSTNAEVEYLSGTHLKDIIPDILKQSRDTILIEARSILDDYRTFAMSVSSIITAMPNAVIIIFAEGHSRHTPLVLACAEKGCRFFVTATSLGEQKQELENILLGKTQPYLPQPFQEEIVYQTIENADMSTETEEVQEQKIKIALAGSSSKIGTTTHAMQIVKFLQLQGKKVCYIEKNNTGFARSLLDYYDEEELKEQDTALGFVRCLGVDIFYKPENIFRALKMDYQYYIFDYGFVGAGFDVLSFLEREVKVLVCGYKPLELPPFQSVLEQNILIENNTLRYLFNFAAKADIEDISVMMADKQDKTQFYTYFCPEYFTYTDEDGTKEQLYRQLLEYTDEPEQPQGKRPFHFLFKGRKGVK